MKKQPERMCIGCRCHISKPDLIRIVRTPGGEVTLDSKGKMPGRGAYLCGTEDCLKKTRKSRAVERALKCSVPEGFYDTLAEYARSKNSSTKAAILYAKDGG